MQTQLMSIKRESHNFMKKTNSQLQPGIKKICKNCEHWNLKSKTMKQDHLVGDGSKYRYCYKQPISEWSDTKITVTRFDSKCKLFIKKKPKDQLSLF